MKKMKKTVKKTSKIRKPAPKSKVQSPKSKVTPDIHMTGVPMVVEKTDPAMVITARRWRPHGSSPIVMSQIRWRTPPSE